MANLQERNGSFRFIFRHRSQQHFSEIARLPPIGRSWSRPGHDVWRASTPGAQKLVRDGECRVHIDDVHTTMLRLLGLPRTGLTGRPAGPAYRFILVSGTLARAMLDRTAGRNLPTTARRARSALPDDDIRTGDSP